MGSLPCNPFMLRHPLNSIAYRFQSCAAKMTRSATTALLSRGYRIPKLLRRSISRSLSDQAGLIKLIWKPTKELLQCTFSIAWNLNKVLVPFLTYTSSETSHGTHIVLVVVSKDQRSRRSSSVDIRKEQMLATALQTKSPLPSRAV